ncbi:MAG: ABC transporter substrate-binding protein [Clostridia bacterium]|nr:ABC transporter substrate-binding protein [Clostridia bacterium]
MKKFLSPILAALIALLAIFTTGCMGKTDDMNNDTQTIYYLNFKPEIAEAWEEIAKVYKDQKGVELKIVTAASGTYEQTLKSEMAKTEAPTIFQINGPKGFVNWKDYCKDLKDSELYKILSDKSLAVTSNGGVYGIPYVVEGYGIIYNSQIMDKYFSLDGKKVSINSTEEINSFDTLKAVVEDMTRLKGELGIEGVFGATSLQTGEDWRWHTHLANIPLYYEFTDKNIDLAGDDTKKIDLKYAENFKNVFDLYINNSTTDKKLLGSKSVADSMAEFALGKCAMIQNGNWAWSQINKVSGNTVKQENIKFLPIYTGTSSDATQGLCIGTENFLCINKNVDETKQKLSEDFLYWLFSSSDGKKFVTEKLDFIAPFDTFEEDEVPGDPLAKEVIRWMKKDNVTTIPWNFTVFPSQNFKESFGSALLSYAQGKHDFETLKNNVISAWEKESK